ncbi:MAG: serine/threonine protein kinase [Planctomycetes bacterium]|nr:serine/threonine protein kinase [Planctomycetota bacterium]
MSAPFARVRALFEGALERPAAERTAWLSQQAPGEHALIAEVERLLAAARDSEARFLEPPTKVGAAVQGHRPPPDQLGPFRLLEPIGEGGMGRVWLAEQAHPARRVAVKVMHAGFAGGRHAERFRAEIDLLARLQHPGIAQVFEAGVEADGTAWFAMELVEGAAPVTHGPTRRAPRAIVDTFLAVCDAVQHAHGRGVIHRDLKPANILVPAGGGVKVIDFGIARPLERGAAEGTRAGEIVGTLAYMSPEQVLGSATDVRTDVYGLGVVLYELLAGQRPFEFAGLPITSACRLLVEQDPEPMTRRAPDVPQELGWIVQKAMRKAPPERYQTVGELAADLRAWLAHEPVRAAPPGVGYLLRKFVQRHRTGVAAAALVVATLLGAFATTAVALVRARDAEASERLRRQEAQDSEARARLAEAAERQRRQEAEEAGQRAEASLDFLLGVFGSVRPDRGSRDVKLVDALTVAAATVDRELAHNPGVHAALGRAIGVAWFSLGKLDVAEQRLRDSLTVHRQRHGDDDLRTVRVQLDLVCVLLARGQVDAAEALLTPATAALASLPEAHELRGTATLHRAELHRARGDRAAAAALLRPLVDRLRAEQPEDRDTLLASNLLAGVLHEQGDLDSAEPLYRFAIDGFRARGELRNLDLLSATNNLLMLLNSRGSRAEMVPLLEQLVGTCKEVRGPQHPETIGTISNLGGVLYMLGEFGRARDTFREALAAFPPGTDESDRVLQTVLANLCKLELENGDLEAASRHGERVLATRRKVLGPDHELTVTTAVMCADIVRRSGRLDEARQRLADAEARAAAATPVQWANRVRALAPLAEAALGQGDLAAAEAALVTARDLFDRAEAANVVKQSLPPLEPLFERLRAAQAAAAGGTR